jgi:hypothetical protein
MIQRVAVLFLIYIVILLLYSRTRTKFQGPARADFILGRLGLIVFSFLFFAYLCFRRLWLLDISIIVLAFSFCLRGIFFGIIKREMHGQFGDWTFIYASEYLIKGKDALKSGTLETVAGLLIAVLYLVLRSRL